MSMLRRILESAAVLSEEDAPLGLGLTASVPNESTLSFPQQWVGELFGGMPTATGKRVDVGAAARFTAVSACVQVLERSVGQIRCELMKRTKDGGAEPAEDHPLYTIVADTPNGQMTAQEMFEMGMNHLCYDGNTYRQIIRGGGGQVLSIIPMMPGWMRMRWSEKRKGELEYVYQQPGAEERVFPQDQIWRTVGHSRNGIVGMSPIAENREAIGLGIAAEEHGAKLFLNGAQIATAFKHPGVMSDEGYKRLQDSMSSRYAGSGNAFKTILLEEGMDVTKLGMSNVDSQFIEARKFQIEEICRIYGVPPHKIQHLDKATFNNIEHLTIDFVNSSLMTWLVRMTSTAFRDLLLPNERKKYFFRFDTDPLLQGDKVATANFWSSLIANRIVNPNWVRRKLGEKPYDGGEAYQNPNTTTNVKPGAPEPDPAKG